MALEAEIEQHFIWAVECAGGKTYKFTSPSMRGVADRIACLPNGDTWFVELKRPVGGAFSDQQVVFADDMKRLHQKYVALINKLEIDQWIRRAMT